MSETMHDDEEGESLESLPSQENIEGFLREFLDGKPYRIITNVSDANVISRFEIEVLTEDGKIEYNYQPANYDYTKSSVPTGAQFPASIHAIFYDGEVPMGGKCVANFLDGVWMARP